MQFAVALIEYLISGIVASAWAIALLTYYGNISFDEVKSFKDELAVIGVVYFPIAYILGIYIDASSSFLIRRIIDFDRKFRGNFSAYEKIRSKIDDFFYSIAGMPKQDSYERSAEILSHSIADAVRTMESYVSRDRIARGVALNSFIGFFVSILCAPPDKKLLLSLVCIFFTLYSIMMYKRLRRLSSRFKKVALKHIQQTSPSKGNNRKKMGASVKIYHPSPLHQFRSQRRKNRVSQNRP